MDAKARKSSSSALKMLSDKCQLSRFSDYFVICGLELESGLEADLYAGELSLSFPGSLFHTIFHS